jgi:hypothetical protein
MQELHWHDARDTTFNCLEPASTWAIIVNVRAEGLSRLWGARHWFGLRKMGGTWLLLDSNMRAAIRLSDKIQENNEEAALRRFLQKQLLEHDAKAFIVTERKAGPHAEMHE